MGFAPHDLHELPEHHGEHHKRSRHDKSWHGAPVRATECSSCCKPLLLAACQYTSQQPIAHAGGLGGGGLLAPKPRVFEA